MSRAGKPADGGAPLLLALDQGTQSARAALFDAAGELIAKRSVKVEPYFAAQPGWAEQHPEVYWRAICEACRALFAEREAERARIRGVALTTQRTTVVSLGAGGEVLRPAIVWLDQRRAEPLTPLPWHLEALFRAIGERETVAQFRASAECNWLALNQPEVWRRTERHLLLSGFLTHRLCGRFVDSTASQVGFLPFDFRRQAWAAPDDWKWKALSVRREQLPDLVPPGRRLGAITPEASAETGIPAGLPLISAGADKACEVLGSGAVTPDVGAISYGTTATLNTCSAMYVEVARRLPPYPAALRGHFLTEQMVPRGYWMVQWFKEQLGHREALEAEARGLPAEALFESLLEATPPGAQGLVLQPFWSPEARTQGAEARGAMIGFDDVHTRAHIYRAIVEGLAYALREARERVEARTGTPILRLRVAGGGSQSDGAMQATADIFGLPAERPHVSEASALGAAISCAVGLGLHADYATAVRRMTRVGRAFQPDPARVRLYDDIFRSVYTPLYERLSPLYRALQKITGRSR